VLHYDLQEDLQAQVPWWGDDSVGRQNGWR
jgi:hypothetical protein